jgi:large subunit ribosomal protein L21
MEAYAVVQTGGKQYRVKKNDVLRVERLQADVGASVELQPVLALSDGESLKVGTPELEGARVTSTVVDQVRGDKVISFKQRRRKGSKRKVGHRQELTVLRIEDILA